jgi:hypothetical protein
MAAEWIRSKLGEGSPPIRLLALLHRMGYSCDLFPKKWLQKMAIYRTTLPPSEQTSFDFEFLSILRSLSSLSACSSSTSLSKSSISLSQPLLEVSSAEGIFNSFSLSKIWRIQQQFYRSTKLFAWKDVPYEISNNNLICSLYLEQMDRALEAFHPNPRVCLIEVGAGHGILSLLLSRQLAQV